MDLRVDPIAPLIRKISMPASVGMVFSTLLAVVDTFYAGMLSAVALAALTLAGPVFFLVMTLGMGAGQATNALVGNQLGAGDDSKARHLAIQSISFATIVSLSGALAAFVFTPNLFILMGGESPYLAPATDYMRVVLAGNVFFGLAIVLNSILNTRGDTRSYRNAQFVALLVNIVLDPFFMFTLDMGVVGVAVATIVVQAGVAAHLLVKVAKLDFMVRPFWQEWIPSISSFKEIAMQSMPTTASMMLVAVGSLIIVRFVALFGAQSMAAYGIALRIEQLVLLPVIGINIAALSITGVNFGARQFSRVREVYRVGTQYALLLTIIGALALIGFAEQLMALFTQDVEVRSIGVTYLLFEAFILPAYALTFLSAAVLQGLKKPTIALYCNIVRQVVAQLVLFNLAVVMLHSDITGLWWSVLIIQWVMAAVIVVLVLRRMRVVEPLCV